MLTRMAPRELYWNHAGTAAKMKAFVAEHGVDAQMVDGGGVSLVYAGQDDGQGGGDAGADDDEDGGVLDGLQVMDPASCMGTAPGMFKCGYFDKHVTSFW